MNRGQEQIRDIKNGPYFLKKKCNFILECYLQLKINPKKQELLKREK